MYKQYHRRAQCCQLTRFVWSGQHSLDNRRARFSLEKRGLRKVCVNDRENFFHESRANFSRILDLNKKFKYLRTALFCFVVRLEHSLNAPKNLPPLFRSFCVLRSSQENRKDGAVYILFVCSFPAGSKYLIMPRTRARKSF